MKGPPLGPGGEDITWPEQVAPRGRKASSTRKIKPQTSNRRSLQILKPRSLHWNSASMRCRQQQQVLLRQLITESTLCSPRWRMQLKLL